MLEKKRLEDERLPLAFVEYAFRDQLIGREHLAAPLVDAAPGRVVRQRESGILLTAFEHREVCAADAEPRDLFLNRVHYAGHVERRVQRLARFSQQPRPMLDFQALSRLRAFRRTADQYPSFVAQFLGSRLQLGVVHRRREREAPQCRHHGLPRIHVATAFGGHLHRGVESRNEGFGTFRLQGLGESFDDFDADAYIDIRR